MKDFGPRTITRLAIFWAAFCFGVMIVDLIFRGFSDAMAFSWPQALIALLLAIVTEYVVLPRVSADGAEK